MERVFDRAFNKAHGCATAVIGSQVAANGKQLQQQRKCREQVLRECTAPMTSQDVVERIALAYQDRDFFRLLQLPGPELNELGRAVWNVSSGDLNKAYRKLSLLVHPDKAPGLEARQAFDQLKHAYNDLKDADKLAARLREAEPALLREAERAAAAATVTQKVERHAAAEELKAKLRQQEARSLHAEIQQQMKQRIAQAALRKERSQSSQYRRNDISSEEEADVDHRQQQQQQRQQQKQQQRSRDVNSGSSKKLMDPGPPATAADSDSEDEVCRSRQSAKRKKPRFM